MRFTSLWLHLADWTRCMMVYIKNTVGSVGTIQLYGPTFPTLRHRWSPTTTCTYYVSTVYLNLSVPYYKNNNSVVTQFVVKLEQKCSKKRRVISETCKFISTVGRYIFQQFVPLNKLTVFSRCTNIFFRARAFKDEDWNDDQYINSTDTDSSSNLIYSSTLSQGRFDHAFSSVNKIYMQSSVVPVLTKG